MTLEQKASPDFIDSWKGWLQHRKEIKKTLKETTAKRQLNMLGKKSIQDAIAMIEHTILKGWTGLREPDVKKGGSEGGTIQQRVAEGLGLK